MQQLFKLCASINHALQWPTMRVFIFSIWSKKRGKNCQRPDGIFQDVTNAKLLKLLIASRFLYMYVYITAFIYFLIYFFMGGGHVSRISSGESFDK